MFSRTHLPLHEDKITLQRPSAQTSRIFIPSELMNHEFSILHKFPYELVTLILNFLPPISHAALRQTCRIFYYDYDTTGRIVLTSGEWCDLLRLLEYDMDNMFLCSGCRALHDEMDFFPMDLPKVPYGRRCKRTSPLLCICSYSSVSFQELRKIKSSVIAGGPKMLCPFEACRAWVSLEQATPGHRNEQKLIIRTFTLLAVYPVDYFPSAQVMDKIMGEYDVFVCPHKQLNDPEIVALYECWVKQGTGGHSDEGGIRCHRYVCAFCGSQFRFRSQLTPNTRVRDIYLEASRGIDIQDDVNHPSWLSQLSVMKRSVSPRRDTKLVPRVHLS